MKTMKSPLKYQGSKLKLVPWIREIVQYQPEQRWVEPFMGSGVVGFNMKPTKALFADTNPHVMRLFKDIKNNNDFMNHFRERITEMSERLQHEGEPFYYATRKDFNLLPQTILLMFLNHTSYNGVMRFNRKGEYNVPFGKNPNKLSEKYCDDLQNRMEHFKECITDDWDFLTVPFDKVIPNTDSDDLIYCDPPYIERVSTYYGGWTDKEERMLHDMLSNTPGRFALSTWVEAKGERNPYFDELWSGFNVHEKEHAYCVGQTAKNRYPVIEALVTNYD